MQFLKNFWYFFPVQLLLLHLKKNQLFLLLWLFLFFVAFGVFGREYGIPYLLLDPEYLGKVDYLSFSIIGVALGGFIMTWNISTYTLNSYRFQFMAALKRPFVAYCINNAVIPITFLICYIILAYRFQIKNDNINPKDVFFSLAGFFSGFSIMVVLTAVYFMATNRNVFSMLKLKLGKRFSKKVIIKQNKLFDEAELANLEFRVDYYLSSNFNLRHIRSVEHYEDEMVRSVFKQNHYNAFIIQMGIIIFIFALTFIMENEFFRIPAGASTLLLFAILTSVSGFMNFWMGGWLLPFLAASVLLINVLVQNQILTHTNKAYGLKYSGSKALYSYDHMKAIASDENISRDSLNTIKILNAWKKQTGERKPKMILLNFSGGGMSAAMFSTLILQKADSMMNGKLMNNTFLMTGASGGMFGAAYFREMCLRKKKNYISSCYNTRFADNIAKDLLNPVAFAILVNDLVFPFRKFELNGEEYVKDRGYIFEKQFNENTDFYLDKSLKDYKQLEEVAAIPMMIFVPTIINDQRKLYITPQPVSYLMKPINKKFIRNYIDIDGVDFTAMFKDQSAYDLKITSAIRMSGTYPYILPYVTMPSEPVVKVMDAGFRDNYGLETTVKFIDVFRDWINAKTGGVIVIQVRSYKKDREIEQYSYETIIDQMLKPIANIYSNFLVMQEYDQNYLLSYANQWVNGNMEFINLEYIPEKKEEEASLSLHLTDKEKQDIRKTIDKFHIKAELGRLKRMLE